MKLTEHLAGYYATNLYLPLSGLSRKWRTLKTRGKDKAFLQSTALPCIKWSQFVQPSSIRLVEASKANGNVRISELGVLAHIARQCPDGSTLFEIGTFDGRTTLNLSINSPPNCRIVTVDIPQDATATYNLAKGEHHFVANPSKGHRYRKYAENAPEIGRKIQQLLLDSAKVDPAPWRASCSMVFVDGSHAYDYVMSDSALARQLVAPGGVVVWHDYGVWPDVTRGLERLAAEWRQPLLHIRGTSLVAFRQPLLTPAQGQP